MIGLLNVNQHAKHTKIVSKSTLKSSHQGNYGQIKLADALNEPHEVHNDNFNFQD